MKRKIYVLIALFVTLNAPAQLQIGFFAGPQFAKRNVKPVLETKNCFLTSINGGATAFVPLSKSLSVHQSLGYSGKGERVKVIRDSVYGGPYTFITLTHYIESRSTLNYNARLSSRWDLLIGAGPYIACGVGGYHKIKDNPVLAKKRKIDFDDGIHKRFDFGLVTELNLQFTKKWVVGASVDFGLVEVAKFEPGPVHNTSFSFTLGWLLWQQKNKEN